MDNRDNGAGSQPERGAAWPTIMEGLLIEELIEDWGYGKIVERGREYASGGRVKDVVLTDRSVSARVLGSAGEAYEVGLEAIDVGGGRFTTQASCDCPWAAGMDSGKSACKHAVAAGLVARRLYQVRREAAAIEQGLMEGAPAGPKKPRARI